MGYGSIGAQLSVLAESLGFNVIYYDVITKLGMGNARQRRTGEAVPRGVFAAVGVLTFAAAAVAVLW